MSTIQDLKNEFTAMEKFPVIIYQVINLLTLESDHISFDICIDGNTFWVSHVALTDEEEASEYVAGFNYDIDPTFSLDEHLQGINDICFQRVLESDTYELFDGLDDDAQQAYNDGDNFHEWIECL